jgi:hypothetical protein
MFDPHGLIQDVAVNNKEHVALGRSNSIARNVVSLVGSPTSYSSSYFGFVFREK